MKYMDEKSDKKKTTQRKDYTKKELKKIKIYGERTIQ